MRKALKEEHTYEELLIELVQLLDISQNEGAEVSLDHIHLLVRWFYFVGNQLKHFAAKDDVATCLLGHILEQSVLLRLDHVGNHKAQEQTTSHHFVRAFRELLLRACVRQEKYIAHGPMYRQGAPYKRERRKGLTRILRWRS